MANNDPVASASIGRPAIDSSLFFSLSLSLFLAVASPARLVPVRLSCSAVPLPSLCFSVTVCQPPPHHRSNARRLKQKCIILIYCFMEMPLIFLSAVLDQCKYVNDSCFFYYLRSGQELCKHIQTRFVWRHRFESEVSTLKSGKCLK